MGPDLKNLFSRMWLFTIFFLARRHYMLENGNRPFVKVRRWSFVLLEKSVFSRQKSNRGWRALILRPGGLGLKRLVPLRQKKKRHLFLYTPPILTFALLYPRRNISTALHRGTCCHIYIPRAFRRWRGAFPSEAGTVWFPRTRYLPPSRSRWGSKPPGPRMWVFHMASSLSRRASPSIQSSGEKMGGGGCC